MQSSSAIAVAAVAQERVPVGKLLVDWDNDGFGYLDTYGDVYDDTYTGVQIDDVSRWVESLTVQRQLATDLPDEVARVAGYSAAQLQASLAGDPLDESSDAARYFSPYSTSSPLYGKRRRWRTCQVQVGFDSTLLPVFTGKSSVVSVDSGSRTVAFEAVDNAETMRGSIDLPLVIADDKGKINAVRVGLNATWVVDYAARKCGYYASPPPRPGVRFSATFAGSAYPEVGGVISATTGAPGGRPIQFTAGKFIQAGGAYSGQATSLDFTVNRGVSTNNNADLLIEGWTTVASSPTTTAVCDLNTSAGSGTSPSVSLRARGSDQHLLVCVNRTGSSAVDIDTGLVIPTGSFVYIAAHLYFTSGSIVVHARVNSSTAHASASSSSVTAASDLTAFSLGVAWDSTGFPYTSRQQYEAWQVSVPGTLYAEPTWNDAYIGNSSIQPSLNALGATVPGRVTVWDLIQQIAAAELATAGFDESGQFTYYPRTRWLTAPYTSSQRTITAADSLTALSTSDAIDQVRNRVRLTGSPMQLDVAGWVWVLSDVTVVPAHSSISIPADLGTPVWGLSTNVRYASTSGLSGQSQYRANTARDGSGAAVNNLAFTFSVAGTIATITVSNPNGSDAYIVSGSGFTDPQGTPALALWGQAVLYATGTGPDATTAGGVTIPAQIVVDVSDVASIIEHGEQMLALDPNPWLQDASSLQTLADDLLERLKDPPAMLDGLTIVGDPRLQLGDRVTVVDPALGVNDDFFLTGITSTFDATGFTQALTVRAVN